MKEIIITYFLGYFIVLLVCFIYSVLGFTNLDHFINGPCSFILIVYFVVVSIYLFYKNRRVENHFRIKEIFPYVCFGISISVFLNMIIFCFNKGTNSENISFWIIFISSGIIGPIYEEILFRYIFYDRLKNRFSIRKSIFVSSLIFGIMHLQPIKSMYAFILGIFLSFIYERKKNIIAPILIHISANSIVLFLSGFDINMLLLSLINLIISSYLLFK